MQPDKRQHYLLPNSSFFNGIGRVFDPFGTPEPTNWGHSPLKSDGRAIHHDWATVGREIYSTIGELPKPKSLQRELFSDL